MLNYEFFIDYKDTNIMKNKMILDQDQEIVLCLISIFFVFFSSIFPVHSSVSNYSKSSIQEKYQVHLKPDTTFFPTKANLL